MIRILGLSVLMLFCIYLVYAYPQIAQKNVDVETNATVQEDPETNEDIFESIIPDFEYLHEEALDKEVDGYVVVTYREYEIHRDKAGNIIKQIPTSNYEYIRYRSY
ncbi:hypothetical protein J7E38_22725 [Bacillus sp. ISL-35]|uniref:hypothetical protein n=1 Tax=Bacillus sp. ISL-35 TaxID=2819122 RepID=UPI001BE69E36|nr:hypothetical protein [Bacillus sp. ISL-35]MBT2681777.1 hypothetical protein [Bacillus sp. ISL-35]MBT2706074.1 hypothetical protein [Chryseobacterium sp. ISL-80]